jgi:FkbM family methyltransferase
LKKTVRQIQLFQISFHRKIGGYSILCPGAHEKEIQINLKRLDDVYNGNDSITKIDVEGVERDVLQGSLKR